MTWLFASTLFLSSALLFVVQPMCAKMLLPTLGGTPAVWNTCMVFFQAGLLLGYCYAHFGSRALGVRRHAVVHLVILGLAWPILPIAIPREVAPPEWPALWLVQTLCVAVGIPFIAVAGCAPLLQRWFLRAGDARDPYSLYAASNLGSFAALILYPFLLEPQLTLDEQARLWMLGYFGLIVASQVCAVCVFVNMRQKATLIHSMNPSETPTAKPPLEAGPPWRTRWRWLLLALVPSSLMLSVTTYLTTDIAAIPLLWVMPLGLYLLSFTLVFARGRWVSRAALLRWMPLVVIVLALVYFLEATDPIWAVLGLHLLGFFWLALVCHGELARTRPHAERLTEFYLWLAIGGVLGGMLNALLAPLLFSGSAEYPLMIAVACLLRPEPAPNPFSGKLDLGLPLLVGGLTLLLIVLGQTMTLPSGPVSVAAIFVVPLVLVYTFQQHSIRFGLGLATVFLASAFYPGVHGNILYRQRSFFGIHRVTEQGGFRKLFHGNILHGQESLDPRRQGEPLTYYARSGPIGQLLTSLRGDERLQRVGLVGLGTGALGSYATKASQHWTFFEIDPAVVHIAAPSTELFSYLKRCPAHVDVVLGDARLTLSRHPDKFGVLVIDAFGSDAIPLHLLTREALQVYRNHLQDNGLLAFHISNNYVDLEPVLANLAQDAVPPMGCRIQRDLNLDGEDVKKGKSPSIWVLLAPTSDALGPLARSSRWQVARTRPELGVWTDNFSNLVSVLRWRE